MSPCVLFCSLKPMQMTNHHQNLENIPSRYSRNSEVYASKFIEYLKEVFPQMCHCDACCWFKSSTTLKCTYAKG